MSILKNSSVTKKLIESFQDELFTILKMPENQKNKGIDDLIKNLDSLKSCNNFHCSNEKNISIKKSIQIKKEKQLDNEERLKKFRYTLQIMPEIIKFEINCDDALVVSQETYPHLVLTGIGVIKKDHEYYLEDLEVLKLIQANYEVIELDATETGEAYTSPSNWVTKESSISLIQEMGFQLETNWNHLFSFSIEDDTKTLTLKKKESINTSLPAIKDDDFKTVLSNEEFNELKMYKMLPGALHLYFTDQISKNQPSLYEGFIYDKKINQLLGFYSRSVKKPGWFLEWPGDIIIHDEFNKVMPSFLLSTARVKAAYMPNLCFSNVYIHNLYTNKTKSEIQSDKVGYIKATPG